MRVAREKGWELRKWHYHKPKLTYIFRFLYPTHTPKRQKLFSPSDHQQQQHSTSLIIIVQPKNKCPHEGSLLCKNKQESTFPNVNRHTIDTIDSQEDRVPPEYHSITSRKKPKKKDDSLEWKSVSQSPPSPNWPLSSSLSFSLHENNNDYIKPVSSERGQHTHKHTHRLHGQPSQPANHRLCQLIRSTREREGRGLKAEREKWKKQQIKWREKRKATRRQEPPHSATGSRWAK